MSVTLYYRMKWWWSVPTKKIDKLSHWGDVFVRKICMDVVLLSTRGVHDHFKSPPPSRPLPPLPPQSFDLYELYILMFPTTYAGYPHSLVLCASQWWWFWLIFYVRGFNASPRPPPPTSFAQILTYLECQYIYQRAGTDAACRSILRWWCEELEALLFSLTSTPPDGATAWYLWVIQKLPWQTHLIYSPFSAIWTASLNSTHLFGIVTIVNIGWYTIPSLNHFDSGNLPTLYIFQVSPHIQHHRLHHPLHHHKTKFYLSSTIATNVMWFDYVNIIRMMHIMMLDIPYKLSPVDTYQPSLH